MTAYNPAEAEPLFSMSLNAVTVVVVTHESAHCLRALDSLLSRCGEVIISDNGSGDGTPEQATRRWPHARVLAHGRNLGFGAANNKALEQVRTPFAFLLNPDCEISVAGLTELLHFADELPASAVLAPQLVSVSGKAEINYRWPQTLWVSRGPAASGPACVGFVCGAAMLLRMSCFQDIGFFDEQFFLYYEDDDLCLRLFNAHLNLVVVPSVRAVHHSRGSVRGAAPWRHEFGRGFHHAQSKLIFARKYRSLADTAKLRRWLLFTTAASLPFRALLFSPKLLARMLGRWRGLLSWRADD
ncbi:MULTISPECIES: glycosyltransferase family 2 protein [Comamonadaceae]|jgi:GT2 family glycosyltransferase|uniref:glycosyltransferase family 2 protein n=1 Tax=Comamonadaceae TaxID=80864 RepID=UPI002725E2EF|nr:MULTISPECIES: glycosyltransferase family 2 protein [Comamonadaceae]MDO9252945.1 glycosyltransferase family 2 protein [Hydrogenophaga sp.]MDP2439905.1 glycosyltransferase family 2 protein [Rhodoferax sp.]MDP3324033.1 glycosyltransferase family 2 protein [Hydrogenophaga sp.]MDP3888132.1 glycosyltransferase family 2 protein [Hydrogenophaga sp.]MDZ4175606.1 glycosyltransferase family 2 protein [Hydrogenophaga sp.]